jgi:hypothetical protein
VRRAAVRQAAWSTARPSARRKLAQPLEHDHAAEKSSSAVAAAQLATQQFRGIDTGAWLAGLTGYRPAPAPAPTANNRPAFSVNIVFRGAGRTESINVASSPEGPAEIEGAVYKHPISNDTGNRL